MTMTYWDHIGHCAKGEYGGVCKYGDEACPAVDVKHLREDNERLRRRVKEIQDRADATWSRFNKQYWYAIHCHELYERWVAEGRAFALGQHADRRYGMSDHDARLFGALLDRIREQDVMIKSQKQVISNREKQLKEYHDAYFKLKDPNHVPGVLTTLDLEEDGE